MSAAPFAVPPGRGEGVPSRKTRVLVVDDHALVRAGFRQLLETSDDFEAATPAHDWWDWYAAYLGARQNGGTPEEADAAADEYMKEVRGIVPA